MKKYLTGKNIKNDDLISTFQRCPFGEPTDDCPFIPYHQLNNLKEQIRLLNNLSEETIRQLRSWHRSCIALRQSQMNLKKDNSNDGKPKSSYVSSTKKNI